MRWTSLLIHGGGGEPWGRLGSRLVERVPAVAATFATPSVACEGDALHLRFETGGGASPCAIGLGSSALTGVERLCGPGRSRRAKPRSTRLLTGSLLRSDGLGTNLQDFAKFESRVDLVGGAEAARVPGTAFRLRKGRERRS